MKIILTGATGFVGEGVLLECLNDKRVEKVGPRMDISIGKTLGRWKHLIAGWAGHAQCDRERLQAERHRSEGHQCT